MNTEIRERCGLSKIQEKLDKAQYDKARRAVKVSNNVEQLEQQAASITSDLQKAKLVQLTQSLEVAQQQQALASEVQTLEQSLESATAASQLHLQTLLADRLHHTKEKQQASQHLTQVNADHNEQLRSLLAQISLSQQCAEDAARSYQQQVDAAVQAATSDIEERLRSVAASAATHLNHQQQAYESSAELLQQRIAATAASAAAYVRSHLQASADAAASLLQGQLLAAATAAVARHQQQTRAASDRSAATLSREHRSQVRRISALTIQLKKCTAGLAAQRVLLAEAKVKLKAPSVVSKRVVARLLKGMSTGTLRRILKKHAAAKVKPGPKVEAAAAAATAEDLFAATQVGDGNSRDGYLAEFLQQCSAIHISSKLAFRKQTAAMLDIIKATCIPKYNRNMPSDTTLRRAQAEFDVIYVGLIKGESLWRDLF